MKEIAGQLQRSLEAGKASMLCAVVGGSGSAPRTRDAFMLTGESGRICGTIGGGMMEFKTSEHAAELLLGTHGELAHYVLTNENAAGFGMVCGGSVDILYSYIAADEKNIASVKALMEALETHTPCFLLLPYDGNGMRVSDAMCPTKADSNYVYEIRNDSIVYVFGGGHLSSELVPLLAHLNFRVVVTDDRAEYSTKELFPEAELVHTMDFDALVGRFDIRETDYIIAVTRGHMGDLEVERFALSTTAHYIGVVGSKSKIAAVNKRLIAMGFSQDDLARVTTPIGLAIKSETPAEIAVSIAAQLILDRATYNKA
ncbi:MAG TPA: XdhC family protein [Eubacteriales bacterium]|nr:XdhC family protein [Eubacteriales bacterium]